MVRHFEEVVEKKMSKPVGFVDADLDARCVIVRTQESSLGNLITDIFRAVYKADVSILNGGCIRSDSVVPQGTVTIKTISTFFPFEVSKPRGERRRPRTASPHLKGRSPRGLPLRPVTGYLSGQCPPASKKKGGGDF